MHRLYFFAFVFAFSLLAVAAHAQKQVVTQRQLWGRYFLRLNIDAQWQASQELEEQAYWFPWRQHQAMSRTRLERKLGKGWSAGLGFSYFRLSLPQDPALQEVDLQQELRTQLELAYRMAMTDKLSLQHRYWSEFRFLEQAYGSYAYSNNRSRYRLEVRYTPLAHVTLAAFDEIFLNIGQNVTLNVFDQNRYGASILYMPTEHLGVELGYFNAFQQRKTGIDFYNRHITRLTVHHLINLNHSPAH